MPALKNNRHEKFCQGIVSGLSQPKAYTAAGYSGRGAKQSAARLLNNADVRSRVSELGQEIESSFVRLQIAERLHRLEAIQDRWDRVRAAVEARAREDYDAMMKTGVVCRKLRSVKDGNAVRVVEEYEIDTAAIEALNSIERRAAIETGQEVDRTDINLRGGVAAQAELLRKAFTLDELEAMDARIEAARNGTQVIDAPAVVRDVKPIHDKTHTKDRDGVTAAEAVDPAGSEGKADPGGDGRTSCELEGLNASELRRGKERGGSQLAALTAFSFFEL